MPQPWTVDLGACERSPNRPLLSSTGLPRGGHPRGEAPVAVVIHSLNGDHAVSSQTEGRVASETIQETLGDDGLRVVVYVDPACIERGFNAAGLTVIAVDAASLSSGERAVLRNAIQREVSVDHRPGQAHELHDPRIHRMRDILRVESPTSEAIRGQLNEIAEWRIAQQQVKERYAAVKAIVREAVAMSLPAFDGKEADAYGSGCDAGFSQAAEAEIRRNLGAAYAEALAGLKAASESPHLCKRDPVLCQADVYGDTWQGDWLSGHFEATPARHYIDALNGDDRARDHSAVIDRIVRSWADNENERLRENSPAGRIGAVIAELGTPSQVERWNEGMLPDDELDAVLVRHLFAPVMGVSRPEVRLDRDGVLGELRRRCPGANVSKLSFSTEEANGLTEVEWEAFKAVRGVLPPGTEAHVVRTVASIQTSADGSFVLRRPLVSLKGKFAEREVRLRVDLGTGFELKAA